MNQGRRITARGSLPGPITLRSGWWKAVCRHLNDDTTDVALRVERGSSEFVERCTGWLFDLDTPAVWSPPLSESAASMWRAARFEPHRQLMLMERDLIQIAGSPLHDARPGTESDWEAAARIDGAAFEGMWRMGGIGLRDAVSATPHSAFLVLDVDDLPAAFAIVGLSMQTSYLQRIAVDPARQGRGIGRSLLRHSMAWARRAGARSMLLNTQLDNHGAAALYRSEGFVSLPDRLTLYRRTSEGTP